MSLTLLQCQHTVPTETVFSHDRLGDLGGLSTPGGSCDVIRTRLSTTNPPILVAVKCFRERVHYNREEMKKMIEAELKIWNLLNNSPNVVQLLGVVRAHPDSRYILPWAVSEYHENNNIEHYLGKQNSETRRFQLLTGVIRGLAYIHSLEIVHGDLKASNIVVNDDGNEAKICDFGSSRICCGCYDGPQDQDGTAQWDSPELWRGEPRTSSSDIWAVGCVALEIQFSQRPYDFSARRTRVMQRKGHLPATKKPASLDASLTSSRVWDVIQHCWVVDPDARPDAQALLLDLEALVSSSMTDNVQDMETDHT